MAAAGVGETGGRSRGVVGRYAERLQPLEAWKLIWAWPCTCVLVGWSDVALD